MGTKQDNQFKPKREVPDGLKSLLEWDKKLTKSVFETFDKKFGYQKYRSQMKWLENSCHGIPWLVLNIAMLYLGAWPGGLELWMNLLVYLILDIAFVAVIKAFARRRRPSLQSDEQWFSKVDPTGVDKFSFPSGHASRAAGLALFFWYLYPLNFIFAILILNWSAAVAISRVFLCRHHILDVVAGVLLAYVEYIVMCVVWLDNERAAYFFSYLGGEDPWSSA
jgi:membrane-associated phospholipid phosphatase